MGHDKQLAALVLFAVGLYVLEGHSEHTMEPADEPKVPAGQTTHVIVSST
jgi:hypothetical protein